jgi:hypothetical protein
VNDAERSYPWNLAARVRASWPADAAPLPRSLDRLLDTAYHASFLRDEERPVTFRLLVLAPSGLRDDDGPPYGLLPLPFASPRAYDEHELRRISPAANVYRALVGVEEVGDDLVTWGLVQSGPRWLQTARGGRAKEPAMPRAVVVRVVRPGHIVVSCGSQEIAELRGGRLSDFALDVFQSKWLAALFTGARDALVSQHQASARVPLEASVAARLTKHLSRQMVKRVVATIRSAHHGGTIVVGPPECAADCYLQTKYAFRDAPARRRYQSLLLSILDRVAARAAASGRAADVDAYLGDDDARTADLDEALFETSHLIAALAQVDGAVVLTKRFEILGFGAEISGGLPVVRDVRRALDLEADEFATEVADGVGTRHRSAYRLCAALPGALGIVVSQDGGARFVTKYRGEVTYWDHGPGD